MFSACEPCFDFVSVCDVVDHFDVVFHVVFVYDGAEECMVEVVVIFGY